MGALGGPGGFLDDADLGAVTACTAADIAAETDDTVRTSISVFASILDNDIFLESGERAPAAAAPAGFADDAAGSAGDATDADLDARAASGSGFSSEADPDARGGSASGSGFSSDADPDARAASGSCSRFGPDGGFEVNAGIGAEGETELSACSGSGADAGFGVGDGFGVDAGFSGDTRFGADTGFGMEADLGADAGDGADADAGDGFGDGAGGRSEVKLEASSGLGDGTGGQSEVLAETSEASQFVLPGVPMDGLGIGRGVGLDSFSLPVSWAAALAMATAPRGLTPSSLLSRPTKPSLPFALLSVSPLLSLTVCSQLGTLTSSSDTDTSDTSEMTLCVTSDSDVLIRTSSEMTLWVRSESDGFIESDRIIASRGAASGELIASREPASGELSTPQGGVSGALSTSRGGVSGALSTSRGGVSGALMTSVPIVLAARSRLPLVLPLPATSVSDATTASRLAAA